MTATNDKNWLFKSFNTTTPDMPGFSNHLTPPHQTCQNAIICCTSPTSSVDSTSFLWWKEHTSLAHIKAPTMTIMMMIPALFVFISLLSHVVSLSLPSHHCLTLTATSLSSHCHLIIIKPPPSTSLSSHSHCHRIIDSLSQPPLCCLPSHPSSSHSHHCLFVFPLPSNHGCPILTAASLSLSHLLSLSCCSLPSHQSLTLLTTTSLPSHCFMSLMMYIIFIQQDDRQW